MGIIKSIGSFFLDILKGVLTKVITFIIVICFFLLAIRYFLGINILKAFFG